MYFCEFQIFSNVRDQDMPSIRLREMQCSLDHEREKNNLLRHQIIMLKEDLNQQQVMGKNTLDYLSPCVIEAFIVRFAEISYIIYVLCG